MKKFIPIIIVICILSSCTNHTEQEAAARQQYTLDSMHQELTKQQTIDSMNAAIAAQQNPNRPANNEMNMQAIPVSGVVSHHRTSNGGGHSSKGGTSYTTNNYNTTTEATATAPAKHKKGWTGAEKGALIGAGAGAISGALIDGRKGEGAIVGGLLGAGAGAGTGALIDKHKKNKEAQK